MERRRFLGSVAATTVVAGCTSGDSSESETSERDSDGDGIPDSEDYAPDDPAVQEKSDLAATTTKSGATTTVAETEATSTRTATARTTTVEATTETATTTEAAFDDADVNELTAGDGWKESESHITAYSSRSVTARVVPGGSDVPTDIEGDTVKLLAFAYRFPRNEVVTYGTSDPFTLDGTTEVTASVDLDDVQPGERHHYLAFLMPGDTEVDEVSSGDLVFFHETDAFELRGDGVTIRRSPHPDELADDSGNQYERKAVEGAYRLSFEGTTQGQSWSVSFYVYKSSYVVAVEEPRGRSRPEYVAYAQQQGFAGELASILSDEAESNGFSGKRTKVEFIIDVVQNLPYVPDDVSKGFDDYTKFITETITEAGGDCEDTAIMLAAVLQSDPFDYDMVLIQPPGHMAAGIYGNDDLPGVYWEYDDRRYYYIETTGSGWGIGDIPETYEDSEAYVYQV